MIHRKRQAPEELLPTRASKIPRITSSQDSNLSRTWSALRAYFASVAVSVGQNVSAFVEAATEDVGQPPPPLTPRRRTAMPSRPKLPHDFRQQSNQPNPPPPPLPPPPRNRPSHQTTPPLTPVAPSIPPSQPPAHLQAMPTLASAHFGISHPALDAELMASAQRRRRNHQRLNNASVPKYYESRDHIHVKSHKARVQEERKKDKQEMIKEIWEMRRRHGYKSDLKTFETLLRFQQHLEGQPSRDILSPSSSMSDLRSSAAASKQQRRHSSSEFTFELSHDFLERAFRNAKQSLDGPKPIKPFSPTLDQLRISTRAKDEEIERRLHGPKRVPLPSNLPPEDESAVDAILKRRGLVSKFAREQVFDKDISRLRPHQWLNDEIINFYGQMILSRSEDSKENPGVSAGVNGHVKGKSLVKKKSMNVHYFSTFFWSKLTRDGYEKGRLAKWTKATDIFQKDVVLIPVNHNNSHWTAAAINFRQKRIESYDSMGMDRLNVYKLLREYVDAEHRNKKKRPFDFSGWEDRFYEDTPQQENGYDCGVFTCQFLETLSRGEETFNFTQVDMPYLRRRMIWEIGNSRLRDDP